MGNFYKTKTTQAQTLLGKPQVVKKSSSDLWLSLKLIHVESDAFQPSRWDPSNVRHNQAHRALQGILSKLRGCFCFRGRCWAQGQVEDSCNRTGGILPGWAWIPTSPLSWAWSLPWMGTMWWVLSLSEVVKTRLRRDNFSLLWASLMAQTVMNPSAMQETWVQSLSREDPLEEEMANYSVFSPGEFHGQRSLAGYSSWRNCIELGMTEWLTLTLLT